MTHIPGQLRLWDLTVDLAAKIRAEKAAHVEVCYNFRGKPLPMYTPPRMVNR